MVRYAMNSTSISNTEAPYELTDPRSNAAVVVQSASMMIIIIAAVGGNLLILAAIYIDKTLQTLTNTFIVNLACADFLLASLGMPFTLVSSITYKWIFGDAWCVINGMVNSLFCIASILTLGAVSIDRYVAIIHPFRYSLWMTRKTVTAMVAYIWTHSFVIAILPAAGWSNYTFLKMESICTVRWNGNVAFTLFLFAVCFVAPLAVIMFTYYKIFKTANRQSKRIVPVTGQIIAPAEQVDDDISSVAEFSTHRQVSSINNETEHTRRLGNSTRYALEMNGKDLHDSEMTDSNPSSKDSGFEESNNSSSMPSMIIAQNTEPGPHLQRNVNDNTGVLAVDRTLHDTPTSGHADIKTSNQGNTEETTAQSESESSSHSKDDDSRDCWVKVPTRYVENPAGDSNVTTSKIADSFKNPNESSHSSRKDNKNIGLLPIIPQREVQSRTSIVSEKGRTENVSQGEQYCDDNAKETTDRQRLVRGEYGKTRGPIPTIVSPSHPEVSRASQGQQPERSKKRGRKISSAVFSIRDAHMLNPTLVVLGEKSAALLRSRKKSSEYRSKMKRDRKAAKTIVIVLGTFILLWSPHFIGIFCLLVDECNWPDEFYAATTWLAMLNSACNPIIYGVMSRQFRKRFFQILRCKRGFF